MAATVSSCCKSPIPSSSSRACCTGSAAGNSNRRRQPRHSDAVADPHDPNGRKPGDQVQVMPDDYGKIGVRGEIVALSSQHIAIRRHPIAGEVVVHFPRAGFWCLPYRASETGREPFDLPAVVTPWPRHPASPIRAQPNRMPRKRRNLPRLSRKPAITSSHRRRRSSSRIRNCRLRRPRRRVRIICWRGSGSARAAIGAGTATGWHGCSRAGCCC